MRNVIKFGTVAFVAGVLTGGIIVGVAWSGADHLPPCQTEDATGCYWDASEQGNGAGHDFIAP